MTPMTGSASWRAIALAVVAIATPAVADDTLVMPYACSMATGRPILLPADQRGHRVIGRREEQRFTACSPVNPTQCRTWTLHRFTMDCAGIDVPWFAIAANSLPQARATITDGRLRLRMPPSWTMAPDDPCLRGPGYDPRWNDGRLGRYCADRRALTPAPVVEMPPGFAPMFNFDGVFVVEHGPVASAAPAIKAAVPLPRKKPLETPVVARAEAGSKGAGANEEPRTGSQPPSPVAALVSPAPVASVAPPPSSPASVVPEIINRPDAGPIKPTIPPLPLEANRAAQPAAPLSEPQVQPSALAVTTKVAMTEERATLTGSETIAGKFQAMAAYTTSAVLGSVALPARTGAALAAGLATALVTGLLMLLLRRRQSTAAVAKGPRDFASVNLHTGRSDLMVVPNPPSAKMPPEPSLDGPFPPPVPAPAMAGASNALVAAGDVPRTREEALSILGMGVGADASSTAIKKIVDGLRLSWHPDQATHDDDRAVREQRIRQINAAWDIIAGKRVESGA